VNRFDSDAMCTALYGIWDRQGGLWQQASAGHPPPLLRNPRGCRFVETRPGTPLGVGDETTFPVTSVPVDDCSTLILYTDGLIERRGEPLDVSLERLRLALESAPPSPEGVCDHLMQQFVSASAFDDVAIVVARERAGGPDSTPVDDEPTVRTSAATCASSHSTTVHRAVGSPGSDDRAV
jgi:serine phosphatase RsbU (regulator of sigma subunit)